MTFNFFGRQADKRTDGQTNLPIEAHIWLKIVFMDGNPFEAYQKSKIMWKLLPVLKLNSLVDSGKIILRRQSSSGSSAWQQHWSIHSTTPLRTNVASFIEGLSTDMYLFLVKPFLIDLLDQHILIKVMKDLWTHMFWLASKNSHF